jgi:DNA-binding LytR/AlgR family response regulator
MGSFVLVFFLLMGYTIAKYCAPKEARGKDGAGVMWNVVLCDDNPQVTKGLQSWVLAQFPQSRVFSFSSAKDLEAAVERGLHADIAVLDILLGQDDGITVAKRIFPSATQTQVIFITGYVEYCSSVYETEHIYFLLKPIQEAAFRRAMEKAVQALEYAKKSALLVKTKTAVQRVPFASIRYLESQGRKVVLHCLDGPVECYATLSTLEAQLPRSFISCHKSFLVNLDFVERMEARQFLLGENLHVPISQARKSQARKRFLEYFSAPREGALGAAEVKRKKV